ncbi:MAG: NUDIX hydrolase [Clostridia bacterium]|nr:NUDIX hydrolase [Clostridia bacterium]
MLDPKLRQFDDRSLTETKISSEQVFGGRIISVFKDTVALPGGKTTTREIVRHKGATCVVPITDNGGILAVRQYRYALGEVTLEIPAGKLDPNESPETCALRELAEETGMTAKRLISLGKIYTSVGFCDEVIHMYAATELTPHELSPDEDEFLTLTAIPVEKFREMILSGEITDAKTVAAVLKTLALMEAGEL